MSITIWHNPGCGSSKNALAYLREKGHEPVIYLYLKEKPDAAAISALLGQLNLSPADLLRPKEAVGEALGVYEPNVSDAAILAAMAAEPKLIQRPVVLSAKGAVIARPKTAIDAIL